MNSFRKLSDSYIRRLLYKSMGMSPTKETIDNYRKGLITLRESKKARKNYQKMKIMKEEKIEKWKENLALKTTPEMTREEKQKIYNKKSLSNKYLKEMLSREEYEALAVVGTESKEKPEVKVKKQEEPLSVEERFRMLDEERTKLINEVEIFNQYVESFKIKLHYDSK